MILMVGTLQTLLSQHFIQLKRMIIQLPGCILLEVFTVADLNNDTGSVLVQWIIKMTAIREINIQNVII